jgi:hypothetical protein
MSNVQLRGNCQICGRLQAVTEGEHRIVKHGYTVEGRGLGGWFKGVCPGAQYASMQADRRHTDNFVGVVLQEVAELRARADRFESGAAHPAQIRTSRYDFAKREYAYVDWELASEYEQEQERKRIVHGLRQTARYNEDAANALRALADSVYCGPLVQVAKPEKPVTIQLGERRVAPRGVVVAKSIERGMVRWFLEERPALSSRMSTRSWRNLPFAE